MKGPLDDRFHQSVEVSATDLVEELLDQQCVIRVLNVVDLRHDRVGARELDLGIFGRALKLGNHAGPTRRAIKPVQSVLITKNRNQYLVNDHGIDVPPAEVVVAEVIHDLENAVTHAHDRGVKRPAAQVVDLSLIHISEPTRL